jgi:hypothetical protein
MSTDRSNSAADAGALLNRAKRYLANGDQGYRDARSAILEAMERDPSLTRRKVAKTIGRSHRWVNALVAWSGTLGSTPFEREVDKTDKTEPDDGPDEPFRLRVGDAIVMGDHVAVIGDSTVARSKLDVFAQAGLPFLKEFIDPDAIEEDHPGVIVITDPPYGVRKDKILNDHKPDWPEVYRLFRPRGGFAFAAYHPPAFAKAQRGIEKAGWKVRHYLAMHNGGGKPWLNRVQNSIDAIFFFEREGDDLWPKGPGHITPSLLKPDPSWVARQERKEIAAGHKTSKPVKVLIELIKLITTEADVVLDPFMGTGSTLIACHRTGRRFIGVEALPENVEKAVRTWQREARKTDPQAHAIVHRDFMNDEDKIRYDDLKPDQPNDIYIGEDGDYHYRDEASTSARR